jgi:hypothetical protein
LTCFNILNLQQDCARRSIWNFIMSDSENTTQQPLFRPSKRRKATHHRQFSGTSGNDDQPTQGNIQPASNTIGGSTVEEQDDKSESATVVQRIRKPRAKFGLDVSKNSSTRQDINAEEPEVSSTNGRTLDSILIGKKFAPQTGLVKDDLDKHM